MENVSLDSDPAGASQFTTQAEYEAYMQTEVARLKAIKRSFEARYGKPAGRITVFNNDPLGKTRDFHEAIVRPGVVNYRVRDEWHTIETAPGMKIVVEITNQWYTKKLGLA